MAHHSKAFKSLNCEGSNSYNVVFIFYIGKVEGGSGEVSHNPNDSPPVENAKSMDVADSNEAHSDSPSVETAFNGACVNMESNVSASGDIDLPTTSNPSSSSTPVLDVFPKYPCVRCSKAVRSNSKAVDCDLCGQWTHIACCGISIAEYNNLPQEFSFVCQTCSIKDIDPAMTTPTEKHDSPSVETASNGASIDIESNVSAPGDIDQPTTSNPIISVNRSEKHENENTKCDNSMQMAFALQLLQKTVQSTYTEMEKTFVELKTKLIDSESKCANLENELAVLQCKHHEDTQLIHQIELQALHKYECHANEVQNYQMIIANLQNQFQNESEQHKLLQFYKSQNDKLMRDNAALHVKINAVDNGSADKLEILHESEHAIQVRPLGHKTKSKQYIEVGHVNTPSSDASVSLLKQRSKQLSAFIKLISCVQNSDNQSDITKTLSMFIRQNVTLFNDACENAGYSTYTPFTTSQSADLKVLLGLSYYQYKMLITALANQKINILAREDKVRQELKSRIDSIRGEMETGTFLMFATKKASKPQKVAYARLPSIKDSLARTIQNHTLCDDPRFHEKIWFVLGCDKGGASTKLGYEVPNIKDSRFCLLETYYATDSRANMQQAFDIYRDQFSNLTSITINGTEYIIERFLNGDYKFECDCCGHQGSSSSFPCLWCLIKLGILSKPKGPHTPFLKDSNGKYTIPNTAISAKRRTIEDFKKDHASYLCDDRTKPGKYHNSITGDMLFPVPSVLHIVPPPLHIRLGLGDDFFSITEKEAIKVDTKNKETSEHTERITQKWRELTVQVDEAKQALDDKKSQVLELETVESQDLPAEREVLADLNRDHVLLSNQLNALHSEVKEAMGKAQSDLYDSLEKLGVCKKLYHGGTLVGNHVKKILAAPEVLCACLKDKSKKYDDILYLWRLFSDLDKTMSSGRYSITPMQHVFCQSATTLHHPLLSLLDLHGLKLAFCHD